jgi:hypothetical protein
MPFPSHIHLRVHVLVVASETLSAGLSRPRAWRAAPNDAGAISR